MRLIDANELIKYIKTWEIGTSISSDQKEFIDCISRQPTAFDVNLIVKKLEEEKTIAHDDSIDEKIRVRLWNKAIGNAIKIVEGGARTK